MLRVDIRSGYAKRMVALIAAVAVVFAGLCVRLFTLTQNGLQEASGQQSTRTQTIAVSRGTIYDRFMQPLVNRSSVVTASVAPFADCIAQMEKTLSSSEHNAVISHLEEGERVTVQLGGWLPPTVGITQVSAPVRYDAEALACHVIGYVDGENRGVSGVEKGFDDVLASFHGEASVTYQVDALGRVSTGSEDTLENTLSNAVGGVALTLDRQIQSFVQKAAAAYLERGAVLVTDVENGDVLASVSLPLYDQNDVEAVLDDVSSPLLDRTRINYNCGSVFKIITAAAALESGKTPLTAYNCTGSVTVNGITFHCHNPLGDGVQTMEEAMANSCNSYFIQLALDIGAAPIYDMATRAGFDAALTPIKDCATSSAILPSRRDLSADAALANLAIGQGDLLSTPYHIAALLQAVANGGVWCEPSLLLGAVDETGTLREDPTAVSNMRLFSAKTVRQIGDMLALVVEMGTGTAAKPSFGSAAGKTGTAETGWEVDGEEVVQSWFAGYYPADDPQYVITVLSENGGTNGKTASPLFASVCEGLLEAGLVENTQDLY